MTNEFACEIHNQGQDGSFFNYWNLLSCVIANYIASDNVVGFARKSYQHSLNLIPEIKKLNNENYESPETT